MRPSIRSLAIALLATLLLAGCAAPSPPTSSTTATSATTSTSMPGATTTFSIQGGGLDDDATLPFDPASRPGQSYYGDRSRPDHYTALDQLAQWAGTEHTLTIESASFGLYLAQVDGQPPAGTQAYWHLSVNGTSAEVGMDQQRVAAGDVVAWTLTPY